MTTYTLFIEEVITRSSQVEIEADSLSEAIEEFENDSGSYLNFKVARSTRNVANI